MIRMDGEYVFVQCDGCGTSPNLSVWPSAEKARQVAETCHNYLFDGENDWCKVCQERMAKEVP